MSISARVTDAQVRAMMETQFSIITGESKPTPKKWDMTMENREKWFHELTFVHFIGFRMAFTAAKERGILNPAELQIGNEVMEILFG